MTVTTVEGLRLAIRQVLAVSTAQPTRCIVAADIWIQLRNSHELKKVRARHTDAFAGLRLELNHGLASGEWFTHNRAGEVLTFNGDEKRIRLIARAYRTSRFAQ